ncbi:DUF664 domain-containing protein [Nocardia sp. NPDC051030]|uniref:mycothiol transferase n=1 Tax=Nocardia sp. NPDC051030 TaxID=3155162 RepID=UPI003423DB27
MPWSPVPASSSTSERRNRPRQPTPDPPNPLIQEYARHNGHADLLRERIDGQTGA